MGLSGALPGKWKMSEGKRWHVQAAPGKYASLEMARLRRGVGQSGGGSVERRCGGMV